VEREATGRRYSAHFYDGDTVMLRSAVIPSRVQSCVQRGILASVLVIALGAGAALAAERPPQLNVDSSCDAAASHGLNGRTREACMSEETAAKSALNDKWKQFTARQHSRCTGLVQMGGPPSYVELLTCLEMAEQARQIPDRGLMGGRSGMGTFSD
jgi:hypothetical protein